MLKQNASEYRGFREPGIRMSEPLSPQLAKLYGSRIPILIPALHAFDKDACAFIGGLETVAPKHGHVQQYIGPAIVRNDEAITLRGVEPFDDAGDLDQIAGGVTQPRQRIGHRIARPASWIFARPHPALPGSARWRAAELLGPKSVRPHVPEPNISAPHRPEATRP